MNIFITSMHTKIIINVQKSRERGENELFITLVPKVYYNVFLLVGLTTLGTFVNVDWLVY